ncbi:MAG: hypothetical protein OEV08_10935 [Nitrospira sp.]|nr:hypothetical protein [Nitrospira sp.]
MKVRRNLSSGRVLFTRLQASLLILSILLVSQGCGIHPRTIPWSPHLKEEARTQIHTIEVVVDETLPRVTLEGPSKGAFSGAGRKAGKWLANWTWTEVLALEGRELGAAVSGAMLALTPIVAATGAVVGAIEAPSAETVESQEAQVRDIVQIADLLQRLEKHVRVQITDQTDISLAVPQGRARTQVSPQDIVTTTVVSPQSPVLTIRLQSLDLRGGFDADPPLALHLKAQVTFATPTGSPRPYNEAEQFIKGLGEQPLATSTDATPLYNRTFQDVTQARLLSEWVAEDAKVFHAALELSLGRLAELIVDDVFLTYPFAHELVHWQQ